MYESHYEGSAGKSSAKEGDKFKKGSRDAYSRDMYDMMPKFADKSVTAKPNTGIQGGEGNRSQLDGPSTGKGNTGDRSQKQAVSSNDGTKDYGKGNPFQKKETKKALPSSIDDLRKLARQKGIS